MKSVLPVKYLFIFLLLTVFAFTAKSQNINGTWEGYMRDEYLQINIQQNGTTLCGFTYDYVLNNPSNHCKAYYAGKYEDGFLLFTGTSFLENSGSHVLMSIGLLTDYVDGQLVLRGRVDTRTIDDAFLTDKTDEVITLKRVSPFPQNAPGTSQPCYSTPPIKPVTPTVTPKPVPVTPKPKSVTPKPVTPKPVAPKLVVPKPVTPKPVTPKPDTKPVVITPKPITPIELPSRIKERKQEEQGRVTVNSRNINLKIYDNGTVDGDTVTVYYDGKLIVNKQRLSEKAIEINLTVDDDNFHQLTLFAENLGSIPPNTALIVVTAGKKRFELRSDADFKKNAILVFKYEPDNE